MGSFHLSGKELGAGAALTDFFGGDAVFLFKRGKRIQLALHRRHQIGELCAVGGAAQNAARKPKRQTADTATVLRKN